MRTVLILFMAIPCMADPPNFLRGTATNQSMGGLNGNFIDQNTKNQDHLTNTISPQNCPAGQTLTGAYYNNGYSFGGTCTTVPAAATGNFPLLDGTTSFISKDAIINLCGECSGVMITSMTLNDTFQGTFTGFDINMATRTYCMEYVWTSTNATNGQMWLNNVKTAGTYDEQDLVLSTLLSPAAGSNYAVGLTATGNNSTAYTLTAGTSAQGHIYFVATSSTVVGGFSSSRFYSNAGACSTTVQCSQTSSWQSHLSAVPTRIDFCLSTTATSGGAPGCHTPMNSGHATLCAEGFRTNP